MAFSFLGSVFGGCAFRCKQLFECCRTNIYVLGDNIENIRGVLDRAKGDLDSIFDVLGQVTEPFDEKAIKNVSRSKVENMDEAAIQESAEAGIIETIRLLAGQVMSNGGDASLKEEAKARVEAALRFSKINVEDYLREKRILTVSVKKRVEEVAKKIGLYGSYAAVIWESFKTNKIDSIEHFRVDYKSLSSTQSRLVEAAKLKTHENLFFEGIQAATCFNELSIDAKDLFLSVAILGSSSEIAGQRANFKLWTQPVISDPSPHYRFLELAPIDPLSDDLTVSSLRSGDSTAATEPETAQRLSRSPLSVSLRRKYYNHEALNDKKVAVVCVHLKIDPKKLQNLPLPPSIQTSMEQGLASLTKHEAAIHHLYASLQKTMDPKLLQSLFHLPKVVIDAWAGVCASMKLIVPVILNHARNKLDLIDLKPVYISALWSAAEKFTVDELYFLNKHFDASSWSENAIAFAHSGMPNSDSSGRSPPSSSRIHSASISPRTDAPELNERPREYDQSRYGNAEEADPERLRYLKNLDDSSNRFDKF